jgi:hypothetical protein
MKTKGVITFDTKPSIAESFASFANDQLPP